MKKALYIIPYQHLYPPVNGGMLRNYFLSYELSKYTELTVLVLQPSDEFTNMKNGYAWNQSTRVISPPTKLAGKGLVRKLVNAIKGRYYQRSVFGSANGFLLQTYPLLKRLLQQEQFDVVVFAHLESLALQPLVKRLNPTAVRVLDAHNIDHKLYAQENDLTDPDRLIQFQRLKKIEMTLHKRVHVFTACSEPDKAEIEILNDHRIKGFVVPNGANTYLNKFHEDKDTVSKTILFCGSLDYIPNKDGLMWFYTLVWPKLRLMIPEITLTVVGRNGVDPVYDTMKRDSSIDFAGEVDSVISYYHSSSVAIVPLWMGSGTRLKILEAMSIGCPVVSTTIGSEGIEYIKGENIIIADTAEDMAQSISYLLQNDQYRNDLRKNARLLIDKKYSWENIGKVFYELLVKQ